VDQFAFAHSLRAASQQILRVGVYGNGLAQLTHLLFQEFRQRYPELRLEVLDADFHRGIEPLLSGEYHVALLRARPGSPSCAPSRSSSSRSTFSCPALTGWPGSRRPTSPSSSTSPG
jgi:DNA-binding transcriptional LysR family regulator